MINGLDEFKDENPLMRIVPNSKNNGTDLKGKILIHHHQDGKNPINKSFDIYIERFQDRAKLLLSLIYWKLKQPNKKGF